MPRDYMPRKEPEGWKDKRRNWSWGILFLALLVSSLAQYLAQIIAGAIVGGIVGVQGLARISASDFDSMNQLTWWSAIIITVIVTGYALLHVRDDLTWSQYGQQWGIAWWGSFWRPVLIGAAVHGVVFGITMAGWSAV